MDLENAGEPLSYEIAFFAQVLEDPESHLETQGNLVEQLVYQTQALGIIALLTQGNSTLFRNNLLRAAAFRRSFLLRLKEADLRGAYHQCAGRIAGLLGAIVARRWDACEKIIAVTPDSFQSKMEYEDNFLYAMAIHCLCTNDGRDRTSGYLDQLEDISKQQLERIAVLRSIDHNDSGMFHEAMEEWLRVRSDAIDSDIHRGQLETPELVAHRLVSIEGLALIALAERNAVEINDEFDACPSLARNLSPSS